MEEQLGEFLRSPIGGCENDVEENMWDGEVNRFQVLTNEESIPVEVSEDELKSHPRLGSRLEVKHQSRAPSVLATCIGSDPLVHPPWESR
jgi:hypothetical protein